MSTAIAIKSENNIPQGYKEMGQTKCATCGAAYTVIHAMHFADELEAERQIEHMRVYLIGDHADEKGKHLESYEPMERTNS